MVCKPGYLCYSVNPYVVVFPMVCCDVHPGLGLNYMQDLGVEEMPNRLDKPSAERNLMKR